MKDKMEVGMELGRNMDHYHAVPPLSHLPLPAYTYDIRQTTWHWIGTCTQAFVMCTMPTPSRQSESGHPWPQSPSLRPPAESCSLLCPNWVGLCPKKTP